MTPTLLFVVGLHAATPARVDSTEIARWERRAKNVTIVRDDWGIPHIYGKTDADAVFGLLYAQAEDDFNRIEMNYLNAMGRVAEAQGRSALYQDLRMRLVADPDSMKAHYRASPAWLRRLMDAFADGLNFYLYKHPEVKPRVLTRFEPWMALAFTEGSIGWDIETVSLRDLATFYGGDSTSIGIMADAVAEPTGSNGIAIAPARTRDHHALLLINPHTSFFFRAEVQVVSEEGLNVYGAVTWGQFFVYQGFNDRVGWMHTSSGVDAVDEYLETVVKQGDRFFYRYGTELRPVTTSTIAVSYRTDSGMAVTPFTVYRTQHGPIVRQDGDRWVAVRLMQDPMHALMQSYSRTKARDYRSFQRVMELHTNSSNNTVFADAQGDIAYFHANFIPRRDTSFDWTRPVDGSNPATDWKRLLTLDETPHLLNPASGWLYNSNDAPWWAAGPSSPRRTDYPVYVEKGGPSARGRHAVRVLEDAGNFTLDSLTAAAFDSYLPWFEQPLPALVEAWAALPDGDSLKAKLADPVTMLRAWDRRWSAGSVATTLGVFWGTTLLRPLVSDIQASGMPSEEYVAHRVPPARLLEALAAATDTLTMHFGTWKTAWGVINRFQRLTGDIVQPFSDSALSFPVPFTSGVWGSLASFGARRYPGTRKWYGTSGNSFVAVVEFGDSVRARAVTAGGESGHPDSPHFNDEAVRYAAGSLRDVYFYRSQLQGHTEREYHPGGGN
jgi:acyl-homoserine-lactone acylase